MASILAVGITSFLGSVSAATKRAGWGHGQVTWVSTLDKAKEKARHDNKPIMLVVHKDDCRQCQNLSNWLSYNEDARDASKGLVMINMDYRVAPVGYDAGFSGGRRFFPRTLFFAPDGKPLAHVGRDLKFKYSYTEEEDILGAMDKVKAMFHHFVSDERLRLSEERSRFPEERSRFPEERSRFSEESSRFSEERSRSRW